MSYQEALKLLGLSDVNPAVFFDDFDVFYFIIEPVKRNHIGALINTVFFFNQETFYRIINTYIVAHLWGNVSSCSKAYFAYIIAYILSYFQKKR